MERKRSRNTDIFDRCFYLKSYYSDKKCLTLLIILCTLYIVDNTFQLIEIIDIE